MNNILENFEDIGRRVRNAPTKFHLPSLDKLPQIIAVSKTYPVEKILPLLERGHRVFGENRVQEAKEKWPALREKYSDIELHLIGPLQTNKVKEAVALFDVIQTVDREKLARALAKELSLINSGDSTSPSALSSVSSRRTVVLSGKQSKKFFIQVNTGEEEQKAGIAPAQADEFIKYCHELKLPIIGLMCIPPLGEDPTPHFALLKKIAVRNGLEKLSMGMSGDFELAAAMGATHIRVGSAIFGERG